MTTLMGQYARNFVCLVAFIVVAACSSSQPSGAAPYAAIVQDARTGEILHAENADTRLHPASLTKMMTLYITFEEIQRGRLSLDTMVTVTPNAASKPPSRLGLKAGQKISVRHLIRAAATKSANDAASALGDHIGGSEAGFARRMDATAKAIGMRNSNFKNANGLTATGHLSTARDMNTLGRRLFFDFPQYYNIFSRRSTDAGIATVRNTNSRFLDAYKGADGIKTGFTNAAGFNLTASAERGNVRIIATVFGGTSTAARNAKVAQLLDLGFKRAPANAPTTVPQAPAYSADVEALMAEADGLPEVVGGAGKTIRLQTAVARSPRPAARPDAGRVAATEVAVAAIEDSIAAALAEAVAEPPPPGTLDAQAVAMADASPVTGQPTIAPPPPRPESLVAEVAAPDAPEQVVVATAAEVAPQIAPEAGTLEAQAVALSAEPTLDAQAEQFAALDDGLMVSEPVQVAAMAMPAPPPAPQRNAPIFDRVADAPQAQQMDEPVVIRLSTSSARHWGVTLGRFNSRSEAERLLLKTQLAESATLNDGLRKVVQRGGGYEANFMGLTQDQADLACRRLQARAVQCFAMGP
ncbi:MAG: serine hydrolase [Pseudotabrizicola sp.]|uniref:serine hydrolase n=1 Tax=Pseudotabrizicola sp. TaxID=2939647 RepID=UPI002720CA9D|nr:serine hydrolase [Pseudotabrizicola sp.]MDO9639443.1 serine hydrolase [Pseudotabrizicola sp.]